jgi:ribosomal RNA-processing protein 12
VESLPDDRLGVIPELISEAVLGTKETNEKARGAGFELLIVMAQRMAKGGDLPGQDDERESFLGSLIEAMKANIEEFITMVAAGLTGTTPHMISASLGALARLLFEYQGRNVSGS